MQQMALDSIFSIELRKCKNHCGSQQGYQKTVYLRCGYWKCAYFSARWQLICTWMQAISSGFYWSNSRFHTAVVQSTSIVNWSYLEPDYTNPWCPWREQYLFLQFCRFTKEIQSTAICCIYKRLQTFTNAFTNTFTNSNLHKYLQKYLQIFTIGWDWYKACGVGEHCQSGKCKNSVCEVRDEFSWSQIFISGIS